MKKIALLGATGSIGTQAIELIEEYDSHFTLESVSANRSIEKILEIIKRHPIKDVTMPKRFKKAVLEADASIRFHPLEENGLVNLVDADKEATVLNALVGSIGLEPTLRAIENGMDVLLANKESLVVGGPLISTALEDSTSKLIPVDSEHAGLAACLKGRNPESIDKMVITASGGSFRDFDKEALKNVTVEDALKHPNWAMGAKITIDSATMMNKVFEIIEAHYLFNVSYDKIEAILHKESIVHAIVHFKDGNVLAHIGPSDMRIPILSAMKGDKSLRLHSLFDITKVGTLNFKPLDRERFSLFDLGIAVAREKGMHVVTMNAANEAAVDLFLKGTISFLEIETIITNCLSHFENDIPLTLENVLAHDKAVRTYVYNLKS